MNQTVIPFPDAEFAGWNAGRLRLRSLCLEGSLAAVLPLAPVIPLFPERPLLARSARRSPGGRPAR